MSRTGKRRAMVFVDGSAARDALKKHYGNLVPRGGNRVLDSSLDFEKLGALVSGDYREFIRLNYYTSRPAYYTVRKEPAGAQMAVMGDIVLLPHEVYNAERSAAQFQGLKNHIDSRCRFTTLLTGRMVPQRVDTSLDKALEWLSRVWAECKPEVLSEEDRRLLQDALRAGEEFSRLKRQLCSRLEGLLRQRSIPQALMPSYSLRLSELLGPYIDYREKGVDTFLAVDMLALCMDDAYDDAILFAADEDYIPLAKAVMRTGRCVINAFFEVPHRPEYGFQLRSACDDYRVVTGAELATLVLTPQDRPLPLRKVCPSCREAVHHEARRCPNCQEPLISSEVGAVVEGAGAQPTAGA